LAGASCEQAKSESVRQILVVFVDEIGWHFVYTAE
jgi:hypothetical protein